MTEQTDAASPPTSPTADPPPTSEAMAVAGVVTGGRRILGTTTGLLRELWHDKPGFIGLTVIVLLVLMALFAPLLAPYDPADQSLRDRLVPPVWQAEGSWDHVLGTDHLGRDMLSRVIHGSRISLIVGVAVVALAGGFGVFMGLVAGYFGGRIDAAIMRFVDTLIAFPGLLLALVILAVVGPSMTTVIVVLALNGWMVYARMTRGIVLSVRQLPYVEAAEMVGCRSGRVILRHVLPNLVSPLLTLGILEFARIVLAEAALSFLGLGIQPPATSWGLDVANGKDYLFRAWWLVTIPGLAIAITVLAINLLASWARVTSDPQEREKRFARTVAAQARRRRRREAAVPQAAE
jgi:peptide/nickel transport system permease protein